MPHTLAWRERVRPHDARATRDPQESTYPAPVDPQEVIRALAILIALEDRSTAERIAADLPEFLDPRLDCVRASDGAMQLAQVLDARRRASAA